MHVKKNKGSIKVKIVTSEKHNNSKNVVVNEFKSCFISTHFFISSL